MLESLLGMWRYDVKAVIDAAEGLAALRQAPDHWDLVITDLNMPGLSGFDVLAQARSLRPDLPVVLTSGYISEEVQDDARRAGAFTVLRKEHLPEELASLVLQALQSGGAAKADRRAPPVTGAL